MRLSILCLLCFAQFAPAMAQTPVERPVLLPLSLDERFSQFRVEYPLGVNGEDFSYGLLEYRISERLGARLQHTVNSFGTLQQFNTSLQVKWYVKEKLYVFGGAEQEFGTNEFTGEQEVLRINLNLGVGYEVNESTLLEMGLNPQIGGPSKDLMGRPLPKKNTLSLRARF
ncbi:MAG: hypothetical protein HRT65_04695 [Flavobacteriaceae bacterium]|nr:hypothetical protein [Flavobacteriaceae bacterium]